MSHNLWYPRESSELSSTGTHAPTCRFEVCRAGLHIRQPLTLLISLDSTHDLQHVAGTLQELIATFLMTLFMCSIFEKRTWLLLLGVTFRNISVFLNNLFLELKYQLIYWRRHVASWKYDQRWLVIDLQREQTSSSHHPQMKTALTLFSKTQPQLFSKPAFCFHFSSFDSGTLSNQNEIFPD